ncbi:uncharacterized protein LOC135335697 [Halichondria panicea]|uniref:uncharacterized protein LOC135335697 n=1 Tax=Halichondria panicea TaxID=6063 RepID=UPI00312B34B0
MATSANSVNHQDVIVAEIMEGLSSTLLGERRSTSVGRPRCELDVEDIEFLRTLMFSYTKIADILGVSRSTLYQKMEEGVSFDRYSPVSDQVLDNIVAEIKQSHPNDGEVLLTGHLRRQSIFLPRTRIRASIHRIDPVGTAARRSIYHADGLNYVWHLDGHHKLIKYRLVTHAAIDGYSRLIIFLKCSNNNRAVTVLSCFSGAVQEHGLPTHIRSDLEGENIDVWRCMMEQHSNTSCVITGSSTHNERVERLWRDVYRCVVVLFHDTFKLLEADGKLDPLNEVDVYCLHYVYIPRIQQTLDSFVESWNNYAISTENNFTPNQLYMICYPTILQHHSWLTIQTLFYILREIEFLSPELIFLLAYN